MNEERKKIVEQALERGRRAIEALERDKPPNAAADMESYRAELQMLPDAKFMEGIFESAEAVARGDKGVPGKDLKRKYKSA